MVKGLAQSFDAVDNNLFPSVMLLALSEILGRTSLTIPCHRLHRRDQRPYYRRLLNPLYQ